MDAFPRVSILMACWNRAAQLERTLESIHRQNYPNLEIVCISDCRKRTRKWMNPAPLLNQAIRASTGEILILQNPECMHISEHLIENLVHPHKKQDHCVVFSSAMALDANCVEQQWYCHPTARDCKWFFCGSIRRSVLLEAGGFAESFVEYGGEDIDFANKLTEMGVNFIWLPPEQALVHHQWHGYPEGMWENGGA